MIPNGAIHPTVASPNGAIHLSPGQRPGNQGVVTTSSPEGARRLKPPPQSVSRGEHHRVVSFHEEQRKFLEAYGVDYDERFMWD
jgi:hypothetical protein